MKKHDKSLNPIQSFVEVWQTFEKVAMVFSAALVVGTFGYLSLHVLV